MTENNNVMDYENEISRLNSKIELFKGQNAKLKDAVKKSDEVIDQLNNELEGSYKEISELNVELGKGIGELSKCNKELIDAKKTIASLNKTIEGKNSQIESLNKELSKANSSSNSTERALTEEDIVNVLNNTVEALAEEVLEEDTTDNTCTMNEEELGFFQKTVESIVNFGANSINAILNADYVDVPDMLVESARQAISKFVAKGKGKDVTSNIAAFGKVRTFIDNKRNTIEVDLNEDPTVLQRFGAFIKAIIVKVLKVLLATGKIVGKAAIVIGTLITKVVVFTVTETIEAGVAILAIAKNEYKEAILG